MDRDRRVPRIEDVGARGSWRSRRSAGSASARKPVMTQVCAPRQAISSTGESGLLDRPRGVALGALAASCRRGPGSPSRRRHRAPGPSPTAPSRRCGCRRSSPTRGRGPGARAGRRSRCSPWPRIASAIWTPAAAHQVSLISCAKTALWFLTMSTSTGTRGGFGVAVGLAAGTGTVVTDGPLPPTAAVASGRRGRLGRVRGVAVVGGVGRIGDEDGRRLRPVGHRPGEEAVDLGHGTIEQPAGPDHVVRDHPDPDDCHDQGDRQDRDGAANAAGTLGARLAGLGGHRLGVTDPRSSSLWRSADGSPPAGVTRAASRARPALGRLGMRA